MVLSPFLRLSSLGFVIALGGGWSAPLASAGEVLHVRVPWTPDRLKALRDWWPETLPPARIEAVAERALPDRRGEPTVLLGFRVTELAELAKEGRLQGVGPERERVIACGWETWTLVRRGAGRSIDTWRLLSSLAGGGLKTRFPASDSAEGLVLGHLGAVHRLDWNELEVLVPGYYTDPWILAPETSIAQLLDSLEPGELTLAPVRVVSARAECSLELLYPREGWVGLPLGLAFEGGVPDEVAERLVAEFSSPRRQKELADRCGWEPLLSSGGEGGWLAECVRWRSEVDVDEAAPVRREVAALVLGERGVHDEWPAAWFDLAVLLAVFVVVLFVTLREMRRSIRRFRVRRMQRRASS